MSEKRHKKEPLVCIENPSETEKKELLNFYNDNFPLSQWSEKYFLNFFKKGSIFYAIREKNKIAGIICGKKEKSDRRTFKIHALAVDFGYRGKGYGRLLMAELLKKISGNKAVKKACLHFRKSNDLENSYSRLGFGNYIRDGVYSNGEAKNYMDINLESIKNN